MAAPFLIQIHGLIVGERSLIFATRRTFGSATMEGTLGLSPSSAAAPILLTAELRHDLFKVEYLLTTLGNTPAETSEQVYHLNWLRNRQRFLNAVLARRRVLQQEKVVDLAAWRRAALPPKEPLADVA